MKLGTETGSLINHVMSRGQTPEVPEIGTGVTILSWSDRHPGTVISKTKKTFSVQEDKATRIDKNGMSEDQEYEYERNPEGLVTIFRWTKKGWRDKGGRSVRIGEREKYYDYSF